MSKHTPGPWTYDRLDWCNVESDRYWFVHGDRQEDEDGVSSVGIARVEGNATSHPVCEANARLMTAAPDLLDALQALLFVSEPFHRDSDAVWREVRDKVHAALRKATGQEPSP